MRSPAKPAHDLPDTEKRDLIEWIQASFGNDTMTLAPVSVG